MLKTTQKTFLHSLPISYFCMILSSLPLFAMDTGMEAPGEKPAAASAQTFSAVLKGEMAKSEKETSSSSKNFFPLSGYDLRDSQTLLTRLKASNPPEHQNPYLILRKLKQAKPPLTIYLKN
ncbi:MAG: hypothetical protein JSS34_07830 [Proteobacteria bacterium]|nr:hypothetical protein [Pseudomonadota bacterium]